MSILTIRQIEDETEVRGFDCGVQSIDDSVRESFFSHILHKKKTFKICFGERIVGFYQLSFGHINLTDTKMPFNDYGNGDGKFGVLWIDFLAIRERLQGKGIGGAVLETILRNAETLYQDWPIRAIVVDALPDRTDWYLKLGFDYIREKERSSVKYGTYQMFYDLMPEQDKKLVEEYCVRNDE